MYKLVGIGGSIRGKEFLLEEGENFFGRSPECSHIIDLNGISKKHFVIKNNEGILTLEDLRSSNGTFVNNKLISLKNIKEGDVIAIPNAIIKVVKINKKIVAVKDQKNERPEVENKKEVPRDVFGKLKFYFKNKIMLPLYSLNLSYEWNSLVFMVTFSFIALNIFVILESVLKDSNKAIEYEVVLRAEQILDEISRNNSVHLGRREYQQINTSYLERASDVKEYFLFDTKGRILRPVESLNIGINNSFSIEAKDWIDEKSNRENQIFIRRLGNGEIGVAKAIKAYNLERQREDVVGYISLILNPVSLSVMASRNRVAYLESFIISCFLGFIFASIIYFLTVKQFDVFLEEVEEVISNKKKEVSRKYLCEELKPLEEQVNNMAIRLRSLSDSGDSDFDEPEDDSSYLSNLQEILKSLPGSGVILNSEKQLAGINGEGEDLLGIRESMSEGISIDEALRDQGLAATIISLCDQSSLEDGRHCNDVYEIGGVEYVVSCMCFIGKDTFPKGFLLSFKREV